MATVIGKSTVLPDIPYSPRMVDFPSVSLTGDTLSAHNAMTQGLTQAGPIPTPAMINMPSFVIPETTGLSMESVVSGGGFGQGIVPNTPRPAPAKVNAPTIDMSGLGAGSGSYEPAAYSVVGQRLTPEAQYLRPSHTTEIYGDFDHTPDVSHMSNMKPETMLPAINAHQPTETFGASPAFEIDRTSIRPTNPRSLFNAPTVNISPSKVRIPIRERPIIPASTQPMQNHNAIVRKLSPPKKIRIEAEHVAPPVRNSDLGGFMAGNLNGFGTGIGRAFGADAALHTPF